MTERSPSPRRFVDVPESRDSIDANIVEVMREYGPRTREQARQLASDPEFLKRKTLEIALHIACAGIAKMRPEELNAYVRGRLLELAGTRSKRLEGDEYDPVVGIERIKRGDMVTIDLGLGYGWKAEHCAPTAYINPTLLSSRIAMVNALEELSISPDDRRHLMDTLLPVVTQTEEGYKLKAVKDGDLVDLYSDDPADTRKYTLSDIVKQRKAEWGRYPRYAKEELALFLEAVLHSEMEQEEKNVFIDSLLRVEDFSGDIERYRPAYEGGTYYTHEHGQRIILSSGESLRLNQDGALRSDNVSGQGRGVNVMDAVFVLALVERGKLPIAALNALYTVRIEGDTLRLRTPYLQGKSLTIKLSEPYEQKDDFPSIYLSLALSRDPRISEEVRDRLQQIMRHRMQVRVTDGEYKT